MSNYPAGAAHDPSAPWNQRDDEECPICHRKHPDPECSLCDGTGYVSAEDAEEYYEDKAADDKYDRDHDK